MIHTDSTQHSRTVWWEDNDQGGTLLLVDQTRLPQQTLYLQLHHEQEVAEAISSLRVRGAPAIGVTAAFGLLLALTRFLASQRSDLSIVDVLEHLNTVGTLLRNTRPTAVNLGWAIDRVLRTAQSQAQRAHSVQELASAVRQEAFAIARKDAEACLRIGTFGATLIADGDSILTHCNAGALATAGIGTALAPIYVAHEEGKKLHVFVDETRPILQGARLTAWELQQAGVPLTLITDNMAGYFMGQGHINTVFVGADRIAANGDTANKIGTYSLAVLASAHHIPFYIFAPTSTIDLSLPSGEYIPVEQRKPEEVTHIQGQSIAPSEARVANPAFDVTPARYISGIITEHGIARAPYEQSLRDIVEGTSREQAATRKRE